MVFAIIVCVLLAFSMLMNLSQFASGLFRGTGHRYAYEVGPKIDEVLVEDNRAHDKIAVINLRGIITSEVIDQGGFSVVELMKAQFKRALEDNRVKAVILRVDSPGGEVLASDEISRIIADFQKKTDKPVIASMGDLAASGGYYVCAPCRWIVANELTLTGSIGVILQSWNYRGLMNKVGVRPETYKSGKFKDMMSGTRDPELITPQEREMLQGMVDQTYARFKQVVLAGRESAQRKNKDRGRTLSDTWSEYADGRVLTGKDAFELGFVDELGNFEDAVKRARALANVPGAANLIQYQQRYDLSDFLHLFGKTETRTIKVDLGVEAPNLKAGQLYFLSPTLVR
jgi:protease-4